MIKDKELVINRHNAKVIAGLLSGYAMLLSTVKFSNEMEKDLILDERLDAIEHRNYLLETIKG